MREVKCQQISVRVPQDLFDKIQMDAIYQHRTIAGTVHHVLQDFYEQLELPAQARSEHLPQSCVPSL